MEKTNAVYFDRDDFIFSSHLLWVSCCSGCSELMMMWCARAGDKEENWELCVRASPKVCVTRVYDDDDDDYNIIITGDRARERERV